MKDTAKEGDGDRNLVNQKLLLSIFKSLGLYSKYALEMFVSIAQVESLLTPRLAEQQKWSYFVNWRGGPGQNIEEDLAQEITNKISKNIVHHMGPNKTFSSISKICKATSGIKEITENYDKELEKHAKSVQHATANSKNDEIEIIEELLRVKPFDSIPDRFHASFCNIKSNPLRYLNVSDFHKWLDNHKNEIGIYQ